MLEVSKTFLLDALLEGSSFNQLLDPFFVKLNKYGEI